MTYAEHKANIFATGSIPDGYFGNRAQVGFSLSEGDSGNIIVVTEHGCFTYHVPAVLSIREAIWMLGNHPSAIPYVRELKVIRES